MKRLKAVVKKAATKAITRRAAATRPPKAKKKEKKTMSEEFEELRLQVDELTDENAKLKDRIAELESGGGNELTDENARLKDRIAELESGGGSAPPEEEKRKWIRGKLPGEKLIKTDSATGEFEEIDREEWESLA
jgi:cell division protein FtsB